MKLASIWQQTIYMVNCIPFHFQKVKNITSICISVISRINFSPIIELWPTFINWTPSPVFNFMTRIFPYSAEISWGLTTHDNNSVSFIVVLLFSYKKSLKISLCALPWMHYIFSRTISATVLTKMKIHTTYKASTGPMNLKTSIAHHCI